MPKRLIHRCQPDSIGEFSLAAQQRFQDGVSLATSGRRTAAVYLWGYAAEMTLKAAYFRLIGFPITQVITIGDLRGAATSASGLGFAWKGNLHSLESWSRLLTMKRAATPGCAYRAAGFGNQVELCGRRLQSIWSEVLRYHKNVAYDYEVNHMRHESAWLLRNAVEL